MPSVLPLGRSMRHEASLAVGAVADTAVQFGRTDAGIRASSWLYVNAGRKALTAGTDGGVLAEAASGDEVPVAAGVGAADVAGLVGPALRSACEPLPPDVELVSRIVTTAAAATTPAAPAAMKARLRPLLDSDS